MLTIKLTPGQRSCASFVRGARVSLSAYAVCMAKKQSRRTVSINRSAYEAAKQEAAKRGMTLSALVESGLAAIGVPVVSHPQQSPALAQANAARRAASVATRQSGSMLVA